jgi:hypothetical protein
MLLEQVVEDGLKEGHFVVWPSYCSVTSRLPILWCK